MAPVYAGTLRWRVLGDGACWLSYLPKRAGRVWEVLNQQIAEQVNWGESGLIPAIAQDAKTKEVLMLAWMNSDALTATLRTGRATYWSRSRQELWEKGQTSGNAQLVESMSLDCDADAILLQVQQTGPACHTGSTSCFDATFDTSLGVDQAPEDEAGEPEELRDLAADEVDDEL